MNFEETMKEMEGVVLNVSEIYFEAWFEDQDFYKNMRFIYGDKLFDKDGGAYRVLPVQMTYQAWMVGQKGIQEMDVAIKLQDADLRKYEKQIEGLKAQLNNMEACYIEKKKEVELLESNINNLAKQFSDCYETAYAEYKKNADSYYSGKCDAFDLAEQLAGLALRGANNLLTDARQKAEDQINNGARLTKHQIDL